MPSGSYARPRNGGRMNSRNWSAGQGARVPREDSTAFAALVERLGLSDKPELWYGSMRLRQFAAKHRNSRYVPEWLLKAWGLAEWDAPQ